MDFAPYRRSLIGFDNMLDLLENATRVEQLDTFPPYDIEQHGEDAYRIRLAVAGYSSDEIDVTWHQDVVIVSGRKEADADDRKYLYRGIAAGGRFERRFQLAPHVVVAGADMADGILEIDLKVEIPEAAKPKKIELQPRQPAKRVAQNEMRESIAPAAEPTPARAKPASVSEAA